MGTHFQQFQLIIWREFACGTAPRRAACDPASQKVFKASHEFWRSERSAGSFSAAHFAEAVLRAPFQQFSQVRNSIQHRPHRYYPIVDSGKVRSNTRPLPLFRPGDQAGAHRVQVDIKSGANQVQIVKHNRSKSALEQMAKASHASNRSMEQERAQCAPIPTPTPQPSNRMFSSDKWSALEDDFRTFLLSAEGFQPAHSVTV